MVYEVTIYSRLDCCHQRISGVHLKLGDIAAGDQNKVIWTAPTFSSTQTKHTKEFNPPERGKYLYVVMPRKEHLEMCEVEVMGYLE